MMSTMTKRVETILDQFSKQPGVTERQASILREAIATSPLLAKQMDNAVERGLLQHVDLLPEGATSGGSYNKASKTISLNPSTFSDKEVSAAIDTTTFFMGHEVEHAHLSGWLQIREQRFRNAVNNLALSGESPHDHTDNAMIMMKAYRSTETAAEVAGWNALQDRVRFTSENKQVDKQNLLQRADASSPCVTTENEVAKLQPGLTLEPDGRLLLTDRPANNAAMFACFFNREPRHTGLGYLGRSDYPNYYGAGIVSEIAQIEHYHNGTDRGAPEIHLNLKKLGLDHDILKGNDINLGGPGRTFSYVEIDDKGRSMAYRQLKQPELSPTITVTPKAMTEPALGISTTDAPLFDALRQRLPPETSPDRLAQIALAARHGGVTAGNLQAVDVDGQRLHVVSNVPGLRGSIDLASAPPPQAESLQQLQQLDRKRARELEQFREQQAQINAAQGQAVQPER